LQLRDRHRLLAVLVAFGTRRATLVWSVLWQTAIPVLFAMALAVLTGKPLPHRVVSRPWRGTARTSDASEPWLAREPSSSA
jgi:membrane-associated phospholipid phosphatase